MSDLVNVAPGQCRLDFTNTTTLTLSRYQGAYLPLKISGNWEAKLIPSGGVTLANTGLTAATKYNIYAYDNAGTLTLEASTTAHAVDSDTGVRIKNGDASRTLVGLAYMGAGTPGVFLAQGIGTLSWFNRRRTVSGITRSTLDSSNNAAYTEVNSAYRCLFVNWSDDLPHAVYDTSGGVNAGADQWMALGLDGAGTVLCEQYGGTSATVFMRTGLAVYVTTVTDETQHYVTLIKKESATQFVNGNQTVTKMTTVGQVCVMG